MRTLIAILLLATPATAQTFRVVERQPMFRIAATPPTGDDQSAAAIEPMTTVADSPVSGVYLAFFTSRTCGPCKVWESRHMRAIQDAGITVTRIDVDKEPRYGVRTTPTFYLYDRATKKSLRQWVGAVSAATILKTAGRTVAKVAVKATAPSSPRYSIYNGGPNSSHANRDSLINHLANDGIHRGNHSRADLEAMTDQQLDDLHTEDHRANGQVKQVQRRGVFHGLFNRGGR